MHKVPSCLVRTFFLLGIFVSSLQALFAQQSCDCPLPGECAPCSGGFTSLTLRYTGPVSALVMVSDGDGIRFEQTILPLQLISFSGSKRNEKFAGKDIALFVNGVLDATLGSSCNDIVMGNQYGSFTIVTGVSKDGSKICCAATETDKTPPLAATCPATIITNTLDATCYTRVWWTPPSFNDNCSSVTVTSTHNSGATFAVGSTEVVYTASDEAGNSSACSFTVVVRDVKPPALSGCPADIFVSPTENCGAIVSWAMPVVTDNCAYTLESDFNSGDWFPIGTTKVSYSAIDPSGNTSRCNFNIVVNDVLPPAFKGQSDITIGVNANCEGKLNLTPQVLDCSPVTLVVSHDSTSVFPIGETIVTYKATDSYGNASTCSFVVTVEDTAAPVFAKCPGTILARNEVVKWEEPLLMSGCSEISIASTHTSGSSFHSGITTVEYVATNQSGRSASCQFNIIVVEEPDFDIPQLLTPDGDGVNDRWILANIENFKDNYVTIVDRWGSMIFRASGYDNENVIWRGTNVVGGLVPTGTYFYTVQIRHGEEIIHKKGFVEVIN